jgi:hypothetical protein
MARASADITSKAREAWLLRMSDPNYVPPRVTKEQPKKAPGSKKLVHGEWVEVKPGDEDAAPVRRKGPRPVGPGGVGGPRDGAL